jgi:AraC-like DNA-binding protein
MAEKKYHIVNFSNPSRILPPPEVTIVRYGIDYQVKFWNSIRCLTRFWRIYWNDTPGAILEFTDRTIVMSPGTMILIPPYTLSTAHTVMPFAHNFVEFTCNLSFAPLKPEPLIFDAAKFAPKIDMYTPADRKNLALHVLVGTILLSIQEENLGSGNILQIDERIKRVLEYMDKHPMKNYSVTELSKYANLSEPRFMHLFKQETGYTPRNYWIHQRIEIVGKFLWDTDLSISEIAARTGFVDRSHLSRVFKKHTGHTPAQVRKKCALKNNCLRAEKD